MGNFKKYLESPIRIESGKSDLTMAFLRTLGRGRKGSEIAQEIITSLKEACDMEDSYGSRGSDGVDYTGALYMAITSSLKRIL